MKMPKNDVERYHSNAKHYRCIHAKVLMIVTFKGMYIQSEPACRHEKLKRDALLRDDEVILYPALPQKGNCLERYGVRRVVQNKKQRRNENELNSNQLAGMTLGKWNYWGREKSEV